MKNIIEHWDIEGFEDIGEFAIAMIVDDYPGLFIVLEPFENQKSNKNIIVDCSDLNLVAYNVMNERYLNNMVFSANFDKSRFSPFRIIKNSSYIDYYKDMDMNLYDWDVKHYTLQTTTDCIDILATEEPKVYWEDDPQNITKYKPRSDWEFPDEG